MSQNNYNVDDILEEVRRKKSRQGMADDTYRSGPARKDPAENAAPHSTRRTPAEPAPPPRRPRRTPAEPAQEGPPSRPRQTGAGSSFPSREQPEPPQTSKRRTAREDDLKLGWGTAEIPAGGRESDGFQFRAPGVAPGQQRRGQGADEDQFSLHFNLDETDEMPRSKKHGHLRSFSETQEIASAPRRSRKKSEPREERITHSQWRQSYAEQELLEQQAPDDDYADVSDAPYVQKDLKKIRIGLWVRLVLAAVLSVSLLYLSMAVAEFPYAALFGLEEGFKLMLPPFMFPETDMRIFLLVSLILSVFLAIIGSNVVGAGMSSLFRFKADSDTPAALAILAVLIQGGVLVAFPESVLEYKQVSLYFPVAAFILLFTLVGKTMLVNRIWRNFRFLTADGAKNALLQIQNRDFAREFSRGLGPDVDKVSYSASSDFLLGFLDKSYSGDYSDTFSCVAAPVSLAGGLLVAGVTGFLSKDLVISVCAFTAVMCICAPLSAAIVPNLMLGRMSKWLTKRGGMIAGYESAEDCAQTNALLLSDRELFSEESVHLHGMKVFAEKRIDEAILDAASVILACDGIMSGVFLNMIGGNRSLLKKVDGLIYEDGMGLSAWVDGKRVLIGNGELMHNHEIDSPSRDYEARYTRDGRKILYIANSGELSAMFVISYNGEPRVADRLTELQRRGVSVALFATDPNITPELVSSAFGIKKGSVRVLPAKLHPEYNYLTRPKEKVCTGLAHVGGLAGVLQIMRASASICRSVRAGAIIQLLGIVVGYGLVAFMAFTNSLELVTQVTILLFGLAAAGITSIFSSFIKS